MPEREDFGRFLTCVEGCFFRAVDDGHSNAALDGSHRPGRYSRQHQPTLYLSASEAGVAAALRAHRSERGSARITLQIKVMADRIFDLRDPAAMSAVLNAAGNPLTDWQAEFARDEVPESWLARDWIERHGALGLIDPSRQAPGLWHLVLFQWNTTGAPAVTVI